MRSARRIEPARRAKQSKLVSLKIIPDTMSASRAQRSSDDRRRGSRHIREGREGITLHPGISPQVVTDGKIGHSEGERTEMRSARGKVVARAAQLRGFSFTEGGALSIYLAATEGTNARHSNNNLWEPRSKACRSKRERVREGKEKNR